jgi:hypothetical protein
MLFPFSVFEIETRNPSSSNFVGLPISLETLGRFATTVCFLILYNFPSPSPSLLLSTDGLHNSFKHMSGRPRWCNG